MADIKVWIAGKEDLILSKLSWAKDPKSEMQLRDVKNLMATPVDRDYLALWAPKSGVRDLLSECMQ